MAGPLNTPWVAAAMTDRENDVNGICLRGKAGWGEGGAFITVTGNSFGARWFDEDWNAQFDQPEWKAALDFYTGMMAESGPAGYATNGFNENLSLFQQGKCGMWIDATVAASFVTNPNDSQVADSVGFALAPWVIGTEAYERLGIAPVELQHVHVIGPETLQARLHVGLENR